jgi:ComF family protein
MHPKRLQQRGFNQAAILAKKLAKQLALPCYLDRCKKKWQTTPQAELSGEERRKHLRHVFSVEDLPFEHVFIIDDLMTTGCTANELAYALKKSGVQQVTVWCCARAIPRIFHK